MTTLVLADHDQGRLTPATARLVAAARFLGEGIDVLVAGSGVEAVAEAAARIEGVARVRVVSADALSGSPGDGLAALLEGLAGQYDHILAAANAKGRDALPRLAARLDLMPVTDVIAIHGPRSFERPIYAGNAIETVSTTQDKVILTVRPTAFKPAGTTQDAAPIEHTEADIVTRVRRVADLRTKGDTPDLGSARVVVGGGQAFGSAENFAMAEKLARVLGAAVGATRAAVDAGYAPNDWQVGQTGKVIAPDLYIAIGISGALQHLAGIGGARTIVAINLDPEAPLVKIADYALVGDLFEVVPRLTEELEKALASR